MAPQFWSRADTMKTFVFPDEPERDFARSEIPAQYASGHPKAWDGIQDAIDFLDEIKDGTEAYRSYHSAISPDSKLLAISGRNERILVFDVASRELQQILDGAGSLAFRPSVNDEGHDGPGGTADLNHERPAYILISSISDEASRGGRGTNKLILWELDQHGRTIDEEEPIDPNDIATKAIDAIAPELAANHEWTREFIDASNLRQQFVDALSIVEKDHRRRHNTVLENAQLGSFHSDAFSKDGRLLLYHTQNRTTQHGMRDSDKLPAAVVYDIDQAREVGRFTGHTDAIMWSAISPNGQYVATVSWDGTLRMNSMSTGDMIWATEESGGQSWAGAFSLDSKYIVWSSKGGRVVQVHDVPEGGKLATFQETFKDWCRCLTWHPDSVQVALCVGKEAFVWRPFDGPDGKLVQHFIVADETIRRHMVDVSNIKWMDDGRLLALEFSEGTKMVYNTQANVKEVFKRPSGVDAAWVDQGFYGIPNDIGEVDSYLCVDGDGKIRSWRNSVPAHPSWWEKEVTEPISTKPTTNEPLSEKYVNITRKESPGKSQQDTSRNTWAERGAENWTAE